MDNLPPPAAQTANDLNGQPVGTPSPQLELPQQSPSPIPQAASSTYLPPSFTYRARLSQNDHFNSTGRDLRQVPNIKPNDILLQNRVNFYKSRDRDPEDQPDPYYSRMTFTAYRALFEDKPLVVSPAGAEDQILNGTPLVEVTIGQGSISVNILDSTPLPVLRRAAMVYEVVDIPGGDYLNVRSGAGVAYPIIGRLAPGTGDISSTAAVVKNGETTWLRISAGKLSGWVNADFVKPTGGKGSSPPQTNQESIAQSQPSVTPQGSEAEQRARYWEAQGYHFNPDVMSAAGMDLEVQRRKTSQQ